MDKQPLVIEQRIRDMMQYGHIALRLKTNNKTQIFPIALPGGRALDFLGYRIYPTHRLLRKNSIKRMRYKLRRMRDDVTAGFKTPADCWPTVQSWCAHAAHANTWRLRCQLFSQPINQRGPNELSL